MNPPPLTLPVYITEHAYQRAKERMGWKPAALDRMMQRVVEEGVRHAETKGNLRKWISGEFQRHKSTDMRVYGTHAFFFKGNNLVTILHLPNSTKHLI